MLVLYAKVPETNAIIQSSYPNKNIPSNLGNPLQIGPPLPTLVSQARFCLEGDGA